MSYAVLITVFCDGDGDDRDCDAIAESHSLGEARRLAERRGWQRDADGRDFCPAHVGEANIKRAAK